MTDRTKASAALFGWVAFLSLVLVMAVAYRANAHPAWNQGYPKVVEDCADLNDYLFPDGVVPADLLPVFGDDATTDWEESQSGGLWAEPTGGAICIRTIGVHAHEAPAAPSGGSSGGGSAPVSALPTAWGSIAGGSIYLAVGASTSMGVAPPCTTGTLEIRVTSPLTVSLSGPVPQAVTVTNPARLGGVPFNGTFSVDTRCV